MTESATALQISTNPLPIFDSETGTYICGEALAGGFKCKSIPISPSWKCRRHGGQSQALQRHATTGTAAKPGIYGARDLNKTFKTILEEIGVSSEKIDSLYSTNITHELAMARVMLINLISDNKGKGPKAEIDIKLALEAVKVIAQIAKMASDIREKESNIVKREFMDAIIAAIVHAFTRANQYVRPSERARVFATEFAGMMPGNLTINIPIPDNDIEIIKGSTPIEVSANASN